MSQETEQAREPQDVQIDDAAAEKAFGEDAARADEQVSRRMGEEQTDDEGVGNRDGGTEGGEGGQEPAKGKETPAKGKEKPAEQEEDADKDASTDAKKAKDEAEAAAKAQKEAEERALLAEEAEKRRQDAAKAAKEAAGKPLDVSAISKNVRDAIKGVKIDGYDNFEAFEKEYGASLTDAITAISSEIAKQMVAPIVQAQVQKEQSAAHDKFIGQLVEMGHADVRDIERTDGFWNWLDKPENSNLKYLVEKADVKGIDMVLRAYKAENGIRTAAKPDGARDDGKTEREKLVERQREEQRRSDSIHRNTGRRTVTPPAKDGEEDITDDEAAQRAFDAAVEQQDKRNRGATIR